MEGQVVHFTLGPEDHRAAIIVRDWQSPDGRVNLQVFWDGQRDTHLALTHGDGNDPSRVSSVPYGDDTTAVGTWHRIERI